VWLGQHEDGLVTHENLVGQRVAYQWPSELVDNFQQGSAALARGLCPTAQFGYAGSTFAEYDLQEAASDGQADTLRLRDCGELGLAILLEDQGAVEAALQVVAAGLQ
jgi:hypothetical protein